jgi:hypothetical protein
MARPATRKYHAGKSGISLCGSKGTANGFHVVVLPAKEWNGISPTARCEKCVAKLTQMKSRR